MSHLHYDRDFPDMLYHFTRMSQCIRIDEHCNYFYLPDDDEETFYYFRHNYFPQFDFKKSFQTLQDFHQFSFSISYLLQININDNNYKNAFATHYNQIKQDFLSILNPYTGHALLHPYLLIQFQYLVYYIVIQNRQLDLFKSLITIDNDLNFDETSVIMIHLINYMCINNHHQMLQLIIDDYLSSQLMGLKEKCFKTFEYCITYKNYDCFKILHSSFKLSTREMFDLITYSLGLNQDGMAFKLLQLAKSHNHFMDVTEDLLKGIFYYCSAEEHETSLSFLRSILTFIPDPIQFSQYHDYIQYYDQKIQIIHTFIPICQDCISVIEAFI
jgi:hypothetical protein